MRYNEDGETIPIASNSIFTLSLYFLTIICTLSQFSVTSNFPVFRVIRKDLH